MPPRPHQQDTKSTSITNNALVGFMFRCILNPSDGCVNVDGLRHALCCLGMLASHDDVARLINDYCSNGTGTLSLADFRSMVLEVTSYVVAGGGHCTRIHTRVRAHTHTHTHTRHGRVGGKRG